MILLKLIAMNRSKYTQTVTWMEITYNTKSRIKIANKNNN